MSSTSKNKSSSGGGGHSSDVMSGSSSPHLVHGHHHHPHHHHHGNSSSSSSNTVETIQLLVDNTTFVVNPEIFSSKKDTMLYRMFFSSPSIAKPNEKGQYVIEGFSATVFGAILVSFTLNFEPTFPQHPILFNSIYPTSFHIHPSEKSNNNNNNNHLTI